MRTIGNIERFLVIGIVVVIGAILTVAITGAQDLKRERDQAAAKTAPTKSKPGTPLKTNELRMPRPGPEGVKPELVKKDAHDEGAGSQRPIDPQASPEAKRLLALQQDAGKTGQGATGNAPAGSGPGAKPGANPGASNWKHEELGANEPVGVADPPLIVGDLGKHDVQPLLDKPEPVNQGLGSKPDAIAPAPPNAAAKVYVYEVQKSDTLERIARALYGDGQRWKEIAAANPTIGDGQKIRAGDRLLLPAAPTLESAAVTMKEPGKEPGKEPAKESGSLLSGTKPKLDAIVQATPPAAAFKRTSTHDQYQVQKGDTLMSIAAANYGTKAAWRLILDANSDKIPDKDRIKTGIVLKLPTN